MHGPTITVLSLATLLALLAPSAAAQVSAEPDTQPATASAEEVQDDAEAYAEGTASRLDGQRESWEAYASSLVRGSRDGRAPVPIDESARMLNASGEQGASTMAFGASSSLAVLDGSSSSTANSVHGADVAPLTPPTAPGDDAPGADPAAGEPDEAAEDDAAADAPTDEPATPTDEAAETSEDGGEPVADKESVVAEIPSAPLTPVSTDGGAAPDDGATPPPGPPVPADDALDSVLGDGSRHEPRVASIAPVATVPPAGLAAILVLVLAQAAVGISMLNGRRVA